MKFTLAINKRLSISVSVINIQRDLRTSIEFAGDIALYWHARICSVGRACQRDVVDALKHEQNQGLTMNWNRLRAAVTEQNHLQSFAGKRSKAPIISKSILKFALDIFYFGKFKNDCSFCFDFSISRLESENACDEFLKRFRRDLSTK